jgi:hypothetical protein
MTFNKTKLALGVATAALAIVSTQAAAHPHKGKHAKRSKAHAVASVSSSAALEAQVHQLAGTVNSLQAELNRVKATANHPAESAKVQELDQWMAATKAAGTDKKSKDNLASVRAGYARLDNNRGSDNVLSQGALLSNNASNEGFYVGGAIDFNVNNDLFGLMDNTSFGIELGVQYDQYGFGTNNLTALAAPALAGGATNSPNRSLDSRLRINVSPKIKFMHDSNLRPWIIPVGLDINVLGVPSNAVSVLNSGMNFGAGVDYELLKGIVLGTDIRYHYSTSRLDGTPTDGLTSGAYVGFKF